VHSSGCTPVRPTSGCFAQLIIRRRGHGRLRRGFGGGTERVGPRRLEAEAGAEAGVWVVPMHSWYHLTFDTEPELPVRAPPVTRVMTDFTACRWPATLDPHTDSVAQ